MNGRLFIIPIPISDYNIQNVLPSYTIEVASSIRHFVVEKTKTARQFLRKVNREFPIDESVFYELNKHNNYEFETEVLTKLTEGYDVGVMSEAGYPGIADPGNGVVQMAHRNKIDVIPLIGPSSLFLALASSGLNGQRFTFHGYLPKDDIEKTKKIKQLCQAVKNTGFAQLFIETPYRNQAIFDSLIKHGSEDVMLTVAKEVTGKNEFIKTMSINNWKKQIIKFDKSPTVFILGQY